LKIDEPEHVFLLRGNHESVEMNFYNGFYKEIGCDKEFLLMVSQTYDKMLVASVLSGHTFCVYGGIYGTDSIDTIKTLISFISTPIDFVQGYLCIN
jgi:hypothetical protein